MPTSWIEQTATSTSWSEDFGTSGSGSGLLIFNPAFGGILLPLTGVTGLTSTSWTEVTASLTPHTEQVAPPTAWVEVTG